jgi:RNA-binding protein
MSNKLTSRQLRDLRGRGHKLKAIVRIGKDGINDAVIDAIEKALSSHELVKVKLIQGCLLDKDEAAKDLSDRTSSTLVQRIGRTSLLYRPRPAAKEDDDA